MKKEGREEDFFVSDEYEEDYEVLPVSELPLLVEQRVFSAEISDLPCLTSGNNSNLTYDNMADIKHQGIAVDDDNNLDPENIPFPENITLPQL